MLRAGANVNNENGESEPILPKRGGYSLWKGASAAKRLNLVGTVTCILDTGINLASNRSSAISYFFDNKVPYFISAAYYILPSATLLIYYLMTCSNTNCSQVQPDVNQDDKCKDLIDSMSEVDGFSEYLREHPAARKEMLRKVSQMQDSGHMDKVDIFINVVYFALRALHGAILIIKANDLASKKTNDSITDWSDFVSSVINVTYMMVMLIYNNCRNNKRVQRQCTLFGADKPQENSRPNSEADRMAPGLV